MTLWNGALMRDKNEINLANDASKLESFLDITPLVALKNESALAEWEIMDEPRVLALTSDSSRPCFDAVEIEWSRYV